MGASRYTSTHMTTVWGNANTPHARFNQLTQVGIKSTLVSSYFLKAGQDVCIFHLILKTITRNGKALTQGELNSFERSGRCTMRFERVLSEMPGKSPLASFKTDHIPLHK